MKKGGKGMLQQRNSPESHDCSAEFDRLLRKNYSRLLHIAMIYLQDKGIPGMPVQQVAEDVVQDTFLAAWKKRTKYLACESPSDWLYGALRNELRNTLRGEWTIFKFFRHVPDGYEISSPDNMQLHIELRNLMDEEEYTILQKLYLGNYTYLELASELGVTKSALAMRVNRLKKRIRKQYEK